MRKLVAVVALVLVSACSGGSDKAAPSPTPSPTAAPGPATFAAEARMMPFGTKDFASADDNQLLDIGNVACEGFGSGLTFGRVVQGFVESNARPTTAEAEAFTRLAVRNLCPEYLSQT